MMNKKSALRFIAGGLAMLLVACASSLPSPTLTPTVISAPPATASLTPIPTVTGVPSAQGTPTSGPCTLTTDRLHVSVYDAPHAAANLLDTLPVGEAVHVTAWRDDYVPDSGITQVWYLLGRGGWVAHSSDIELTGDCDGLPFSIPTPEQPSETAIDFTLATSADLGERTLLAATLPDDAGHTTHIIAIDMHFPQDDPGGFVRWLRVSITCEPADADLRWEEWLPGDLGEAITPAYRCGDVHPTAPTPERNPTFLHVVAPSDDPIVTYSLGIVVEPYSP